MGLCSSSLLRILNPNRSIINYKMTPTWRLRPGKQKITIFLAPWGREVEGSPSEGAKKRGTTSKRCKKAWKVPWKFSPYPPDSDWNCEEFGRNCEENFRSGGTWRSMLPAPASSPTSLISSALVQSPALWLWHLVLVAEFFSLAVHNFNASSMLLVKAPFQLL
jgi:hypothetical protein